MKKVILLLLAMVANVYAGSFYVGGGLAVGSAERTVSGSSTSTSSDLTGLDINVGYVFDSDNRIEVSQKTLTATASSNEVKYAGTDFNWVWTVNYNEMFMPFLTLGFGSYNVQTSTTTLSGSSINGGFGLLVILDEYEVEVGMRNTNVGYTASGISVTEAMTANYIGLKYKF